jgi:hypothetical protein
MADALDDPSPGEVHDRAVHAHHRGGRDPRPDVGGVCARLLGEQGCQRGGIAGEDLLLAGQEGGAAGDHARERRELLAGSGVALGE